ncbi:U-box domain-containing protein 51 [Sesamum angolense]|uniref:RING-type E3 ubiquitin transferase n=1 Tax=Sesamum angolense TaxID=2727404 RepID=A0AAE1XFJ9_9LAMI|nr:U-box domain-containing protein 51 [Sesamum angolense]
MANCELENLSEEGTPSTVVAVDRDKNSQFAVRWAVENFRMTNRQIILVYVCTQQNLRPQDSETRALTQVELQQLFLPYRGFCARKGIRAKEVILHATDVATALCEFISANCINTIVLGASSRGAIARAFKNTDIPTSVGRYAPDFCSVFCVSKGKALKIKCAKESPFPITPTTSMPQNTSFSCDIPPKVLVQGSWRTASDRSVSDGQRGSPESSKSTSPPHSVSSNDSLPMLPWGKRPGSKSRSPMGTENVSFETASFNSSNSGDNVGTGDFDSGRMTPLRRLPGGKMTPFQQSANRVNLRGRTLESLPDFSSVSSERSDMQSFQSDISYELMDRMSDSSRSSTSSVAAELEEELRRMKLELKQTTERYSAACQEAETAKEKVRDLIQWRTEEATRIEEAKHSREAALAIIEREKQKCKAALEIAQKAQRIAELETEKRKRAELKFKQESEEKQKAMTELANSVVRYRMYAIEEIEVATNYFSSSNKIGEGGYGPVYKATMDHTAVAIKVLKSKETEGLKQFQQEVEVLSRMRHPNMVILLGACPEYGCLVYEYMENGCLDDRLFCKDGTPPLPWTTRFQIAADIATALNFLHNTKPEPLVHRDLKPANILLDKNFVSKISDVGLSRLVPPSVADSVTQYHMTAAAGTFCYIDPEYQQTGMLGTKSDIYSFGILLLQIITAKSPMGLTHQVECAIETGRFPEILDQNIKDWPIEEALSFAKLALKCCELRRRDRPDLDTVILPELERLRDLGSQIKPEGRAYYMHLQGPTSLASSSSSQNTRNNSEIKTENQSKKESGYDGSTVTSASDSSSKDRSR